MQAVTAEGMEHDAMGGGYKPQDLPMDRTYTLPFNAVNGYAVSTKGAAYAHFVEIMTSLAGQVYSVSPTDDPATTDPSSAVRVPISSLFAHLKDNAVNSSCADDPGAGCETARRNREWLLAYGEVKKTCIRKTAYEADMPIDITRPHEHIYRQHDPAVDAPQETKAAHKVARSNRKRKGSPAVETNRLHKKICLDRGGGLTRQETRIGSCATELMSHNIRCYGTGIMVENFMVKLWYADRHGVVVLRPFDMFVECDKLLLVVAAIAGADIAKMGVCPFLRFPSSKFNSYEDVKLVFQPGPMTKGLPEVKYIIDTSRIVETDFEIVSRGTTIIFLKATADTGSEGLVAKMIWPPESRVADRSRLAQKPQYLQNIEIRLPRASMTLHNFEYEHREFRMIVMKRYEELEQVRTHHWVWETSNILHRDISSNNIMFYRDDGRVVGVLCDWDMAACISHEDKAVKTERTTTIDKEP
ncbi:hypothetical protein POSPLADRAFT_1037599 [Postia placenta MAD-698-R-SB12]|uniref:Fungal-type protein kinase domain-containing protein n=1 Tax=Postia placenta MAD-698-R-SB12 TaxID=670580 RepID=A0A1X6MIX4_9APHY|nr:hypothetical protein POSPLADRAFT_1037599 [Postia placenta MAD-698-R-SB12]OSX56320.1 hypothetical protein POSPLADRAFT_1037599 [Postia placenta MAD-698-R-SB12]